MLLVLMPPVEVWLLMLVLQVMLQWVIGSQDDSGWWNAKTIVHLKIVKSFALMVLKFLSLFRTKNK